MSSSSARALLAARGAAAGSGGFGMKATAGSMRGAALPVNLPAVRLGAHWRRAGVISLALLAALGCRHRGGTWTSASAPASLAASDNPVELLVIGAPRDKLATGALARELDERLRAAAAARRPAILIWLGPDLGPPGPERSGACPSAASLFAGRRLAALTEVTTRAVEAGAYSFGLPGPDAWRCGLHGFSAAAGPLPYRQPGANYVVRVLESGAIELPWSCAGERCELQPASEAVRVELVFLELSPWLFPELATPDLDAVLAAEQRELLRALAAAPPPRSPRILVSPIPVESAGTRGLGGRKQRTSFRYLPEPVQDALAAGLFVGTIGALERDLQVSADLSNAIARGDRSYVEAPIFALVSGAAGGAGHTLPTSRGFSLLPDLWSEHAGFARVLIGATTASVQLHARVAGRWRQAAVEVPLAPAPRGSLREPPTIQPCPSCDPQAGAADGDVYVPRGPRPR